MPEGTTDIAHDAPLTEIWALGPREQRYRIYRGDTQAHIDWKIEEYRKRKIKLEVIEVPREGVPA